MLIDILLQAPHDHELLMILAAPMEFNKLFPMESFVFLCSVFELRLQVNWTPNHWHVQM